MKNIKYILIHFFDFLGIRRKRTEADFKALYDLRNSESEAFLRNKMSWLTDSEIVQLINYTIRQINKERFELSFKKRKAVINNAILENAIENENYELAAKMRDIIKKNK